MINLLHCGPSGIVWFEKQAEAWVIGLSSPVGQIGKRLFSNHHYVCFCWPITGDKDPEVALRFGDVCPMRLMDALPAEKV